MIDADDHRGVDTGVYSLIRHPIYAGNLLLFGGAALWLGGSVKATSNTWFSLRPIISVMLFLLKVFAHFRSQKRLKMRSTWLA